MAMAELPLRRSASLDNRKDSSSRSYESPPHYDGDGELPFHRSQRNPNTYTIRKVRPWQGRSQLRKEEYQQKVDDLSRAAAVLLADASSFLFTDMCLSCSSTVKTRLSSLASGKFFVADPPIEERPSSAISTNNEVGRHNKPEGAQMCDCPSSFFAADLPIEEKPEDTDISDFSSSSDHQSNSETSLHPNDRIKKFKENGINNDKRRQLRRDSVGSIMLRKAIQSISGSSVETRTPKSMSVLADQCGQTISRSISNGSIQAQTPITQSSSVQQPDASLLLEQSCASPFSEQCGHSLKGMNHTRISEVVRKKDFCLMERVNGRTINILEGLELHKNVFNLAEQKDLVDSIYELQELGRRQKLRRRTYSEPRKWMRGKGRVTLQFGCCYNYAVDKDGNPPGILREEEVDKIPPKLRIVIKRLVEWEVLPSNCVPDSCIVNIYEVGDCIPPHIDHHDFLRPFCTLSLLSECNIIFGTNLQVVGPGEFKGSYSIPLPTGSVLILNGNGANIAKHSVPAVPTKRISITFRKMDPLKVPNHFTPDMELLSTRSLMGAKCNKSKVTTCDSDFRNDLCSETNFDNEKKEFII